MLLERKQAVIYGAAGQIGSAVAAEFARQGATVHLTGRTQSRLDALAETIRAEGGRAETAVVNALDEPAVDAHAAEVAARFGSLDISFNLITHGDVQGIPLEQMSTVDVMTVVDTAVRTTFITSRAAARHMIRQRSGVILTFGGKGDPVPGYHLGGLQVAFDAVDSLRRAMANEWGKYGIRAVTLLTSGIIDSVPAGDPAMAEILQGMVDGTMLKRAATREDVGRVAAFAASEHARTITGSPINISCGAIVD
ncbi:SDR family NAD(P)-dependent oxidoreductase [Crossiella sp. CA198]|uniref:SDR family NAD(P)-dependent oxidoreductase n=1 Tax=Crossiella sp. CA198 TaxID=3455607 RepID=UPI003F8D3A3D